MDIFENSNIQGNPVNWTCCGHVDFDNFKIECKRLFDVDVVTVSHIWMRDTKKHTRDKNGNITSSCNVFVGCSRLDVGSVAITAGKKW